MRGKVEAAILAMERNGITPACAGKSNQITPVSRRGEDHPRVCGEKELQASVFRSTWGSPPRVRGKGLGCRKSQADYGITPACAGKRTMPLQKYVSAKDHPRVCGEKYSEICNNFFGQGSPPRVRGKGIIP